MAGEHGPGGRSPPGGVAHSPRLDFHGCCCAAGPVPSGLRSMLWSTAPGCAPRNLTALDTLRAERAKAAERVHLRQVPPPPGQVSQPAPHSAHGGLRELKETAPSRLVFLPHLQPSRPAPKSSWPSRRPTSPPSIPAIADDLEVHTDGLARLFSTTCFCPRFLRTARPAPPPFLGKRAACFAFLTLDIRNVLLFAGPRLSP